MPHFSRASPPQNHDRDGRRRRANEREAGANRSNHRTNEDEICISCVPRCILVQQWTTTEWMAIYGIFHLHSTLLGRSPRVDRRTAPMRTHSIIIRQRSNTTYLLSAWPQVVAQQFGTAQKWCANCGCGRTPCLRIRNKTWRQEVRKGLCLPRLLLPTRASSYASERRRQEEVTNERTEEGGREGRATEARLEDRERERANRRRNERPRFAIRGQGRAGRAVPPFLPSSFFFSSHLSFFTLK